jgi:hypothetical protein
VLGSLLALPAAEKNPFLTDWKLVHDGAASMATLDAAQRTARPCLLLSQHLLGPTYRLPGVEANTGDPLRIFLDAEFNGFGGELISIALVCEDGQEWYEVVEIPAEPHPFVAQHVLPVLGKEPIGRDRFAQSLAAFLASVPEPVIIADWPDDIRCLCDGLGQFGSGMRFRLGCTLVLLPQQPLCALQTVHNALLDARALRLWHAEGASAVACTESSAAGL